MQTVGFVEAFWPGKRSGARRELRKPTPVYSPEKEELGADGSPMVQLEWAPNSEGPLAERLNAAFRQMGLGNSIYF